MSIGNSKGVVIENNELFPSANVTDGPTLHVDTWGSTNSGILWSEDITIRNNVVHDTYGEGMYINGHKTKPTAGNLSSKDILIEGNTIYNTGIHDHEGDCIDAKDGIQNLIIRNNHCFNTFGGTASGIHSASTFLAEGNIIHNTTGRGIVGGTTNGTGHNGSIVRNNLIYSTGKAAIYFNDNVGKPVNNITIANNTISNSDTGISVGSDDAGVNNLVVKNNIVINSGVGISGWGTPTNFVTNYNNVFGNGTNYKAPFNTPGPNDLSVDPELDSNFLPKANSAVCSGGEFGSYIGAYPCSSSTISFPGSGSSNTETLPQSDTGVTSWSTPQFTATFESMGIKVPFTGDTNKNASCKVEYRATGTSLWREGHDLWRDDENSQCIGSVVYLQPDITYEFRLTVIDPDGVPTLASLIGAASTWSENFPVSSQDSLSNRTTPLTITGGGSSSGYKVYGPSGNNRITIDVGTAYERAMVVDANYVILRNIDFIGGHTNSLLIADNRHDVIIENCTFSKFGPAGKASGPGTFPTQRQNTAILVGNKPSGSGVSRVVIQGSTIFEPNGGSNSWDQGHPTGPHAIYFTQTDGNHVVRNNHIYSIPNRYYNDAIGGTQNQSTTYGNINRDSDIYGNIISHVWDDAIEVEGRNENCRVWGNYIENSRNAVASGAVTAGPLYVFRNVFVKSYASEANPDARSTAFKVGRNVGVSGAQFTYHNTITGPHEAANAILDSAGSLANHTSRNNIFDVTSRVVRDRDLNPSNSFDYDLIRTGATWTGASGTYANAIRGVPSFTQSGPYGGAYGKFLSSSSAGYRQGTSIPNFSDSASGSPISNPNVGAFDEGFPALQFGPQ